MLPLDPSLLSLLGPPCIGAFIGYVTNKIAIRMLFRPLRPWYLLGIRVPMTPGVIPRKRRQLAVNIGEMVGRHLLTTKDIGAAISEEPFQEHLAVLVDRHIERLCRQELGALPDIVPDRFKSYFRIGIRSMKYRLGDGVNGYLAGTLFEEQIVTRIESRLDTLGDQDVNDLLAPENRQAIYNFLEKVIRDLLVSDRTGQWLAEYLASGLRRSAAEGRTIGDILPQALVETFRGIIAAQGPAILRRLATRLAEPEFRGEIVTGILGGVDQFLDSLGPVGAVARGFFEKDTFTRKIGAYLDEREGDLIAWLGSPEVQARMVEVLGENIDALLEKQLAEVIATIGDERLNSLCCALSSQLLAVFRSQGTLTGLSTMLQAGVEDLLDSGRRPLGDLAGRIFSEAERGRLRAALVYECSALIRSAETKRLVNSVVSSMVDSFLAKPVGLLYNVVPHGIRRGVSEYVVLSANRLFLREVPGVIESLNIKRVVTDKVDGLDLPQLERLLLSIMEEQLKYINLFGALLGFLIGLANLILLRFT